MNVIDSQKNMIEESIQELIPEDYTLDVHQTIPNEWSVHIQGNYEHEDEFDRINENIKRVIPFDHFYRELDYLSLHEGEAYYWGSFEDVG